MNHLDCKITLRYVGMSEPVEPIRQNELAAVMIVHLQLSSQCCRYESPGLQNYSPLPDRIMIKPAALTPCLACIAFPIPPPTARLSQ